MTTTARVTLTIEINASSSWSDETTIKQIRNQAIEGALGHITRIAKNNGLKIIGKPSVTTTTTENI